MTSELSAVTVPKSIEIKIDVPMKLRDGTILYSNVYRPLGIGPVPVLLTRTPYGKDSPPALGFHSELIDPVAAAHAGYMIVVQDVRGTHKSEGEFEAFRHEFEDGPEAVRWAAGLEGSTGAVGMYGTSYFGHTQFAAAAGAGDELKAIAPSKRCADPLNGMYFRQGAFELCMQVSWYMMMSTRELVRSGSASATFANELREFAAAADSLQTTGYHGRPLSRHPLLVGRPVTETFFTPVDHPMDSEALEFLDMSRRYDSIRVPALHIGGWYDIFLQQTLDDFVAMRQRGVPTQLVVGPGEHSVGGLNPIGEGQFGIGAQDLTMDLTDSVEAMQLRWMDRWVKGLSEVPEDPIVRIFVMGANEWRSLPDWPPPSSDIHLHLRSDGKLTTSPPGNESADSFVYDPDSPVPTRGGSIMADSGHPAGVFDQRDVEERSDVLTYTTEALESDVEVIGRLTASVWVSSSAVDTDFVVRLSDVHPDGRSMNIVDGIIRAQYRHNDAAVRPELLEPGLAYEMVIDLWSTAHVFKAGHKMRVAVTSSNFPRWDANPNTGDPWNSTSCVTARNSILHDPEHPSHIRLPVTSGSQGVPE